MKETSKIKTFVHCSTVHSNVCLKYEKEIDGSEIDEPDLEQGRIYQTNNSNDTEVQTISNGNEKKTKRVYECQTCSEKFIARWEFKLHLTDHPQGNVLQCKFCQKEYNRPSELQTHLRSHTGARPVHCEICGMSFMGKNTLRKHEHIHSRNRTKEFECEVCKKTFSRRQYLQEHKRTHTGSKPYICNVCHKGFVGKTGLNHHKKTHKSADEKKSSVCEICGKSFTRHALWTHMKLHNKEHKCEYCSKSFATTAGLKIHEAGTHLGHNWHHCSTCGKGFVRKGHLSRHIKTHDNSKQIIFTCSQCPSKFKDEAHLKAHVKRKHTERNNKSPTCGICGKRFSTQSMLSYHQRLHFLERPHRCNECGKTFAMPYLLRDHIRLHHSDEKLFPCTVCTRKCATQALLNKHLSTHRPTFTPKIKPPGSFTCIYCDKIFPSKLALSNHSRTHAFSRPYQCNVCRKAFRYQESLIKHLRLHPNDSTPEATATKELPCIYTIQVSRPSFLPISSDTIGNEVNISEQTHCELLSNGTISKTVSDLCVNECISISEKSSDINVIPSKPVNEMYLSQSMLQSEEAEFSDIQSMGSSSVCNDTIEKSIDTSDPQQPYRIPIDGNLYSSSLSTEGNIVPSITLLNEKTDLSVSNSDATVPSHSLQPVTLSSPVFEFPHLQVPLQSDHISREFNAILRKDFSI